MTPSGASARVVATAAASAAIGQLRAVHGPVLFIQSGGCCDGSVPLCFEEGDLALGPGDVELGTVAGCPFYVWGSQTRLLEGCQLVLDVAPGLEDGFSLPAPDDAHFVLRSRPLPREGRTLADR